MGTCKGFENSQESLATTFVNLPRSYQIIGGHLKREIKIVRAVCVHTKQKLESGSIKSGPNYFIGWLSIPFPLYQIHTISQSDSLLPLIVSVIHN